MFCMLNTLVDLYLHFYYTVQAVLGRQFVVVDVDAQHLVLYRYGVSKVSYSVSTSKFGMGEKQDSYQTPRGWFRICECIGGQADLDVIFKGREPHGKYDDQLSTEQDPILARVIRLDGVQQRNKNTFQRYIYIHGSPSHEVLNGENTSIGCVRMCPEDVAMLYSEVHVGTLVYIHDRKKSLSWQPSYFNSLKMFYS